MRWALPFRAWLAFAFLSELMASEFTAEKMRRYREKVRRMFYHAYNGYLTHAYPLDELKPISCRGQDTWGSFSLSLIDALDTLLVMGNTTEFTRAAKLVLESVRTDANVNVSVFETNIRVVGGLISAHMLLSRVEGHHLPPGWPCSGPLLKLAQEMADRLLPAFNTDTGMPFGTVNLRYGVHRGETPVTCTAGAGTFIVEFGTLSRLTGNPEYERLALRALDSLWETRSPTGLVGNHINVNTGQWTATDAGIGAGVDSYFEYLVKGAYLFQKPHLLAQFNKYVHAINKHVRKGDWFYWVNMHKATTSMPVYQSLEAFWPGLLTMIGDIEDATRIMLQYSQVIRQYGFPPEFYNVQNMETVEKRAAFPLRPEMAESLMYLYRATEDEAWLELGAQLIDAIEHSARTPCGYATVNNVNDHSQEDRMESFFLAETTKYLYLLFDPENFIHNEGSEYRVVETMHGGECVYESGGYIFNTEAHPVDPALIRCCSTAKRENELLNEWKENVDVRDLFGHNNDNYKVRVDSSLKEELERDEEKFTSETKFIEKHYGSADIEFETDPEFKKQADALKAQKEKAKLEQKKLDEENRNNSTVKYTSKKTKKNENKPAKLRPSTKLRGKRDIEKRREEIIERRETRRKQKDDLELKTMEIFKQIFEQAAKLDKENQEKKKPTRIFENLKSIVDSIIREITPSLYGQLSALSSDALTSIVIKRSFIENISVAQARCQQCCYPLDYMGYSLQYRLLIHLIYQNYLYPKWKISFVHSPACFPEDEPRIEDSYINVKPELDVAYLSHDDMYHYEALHSLPTFSPGSFEFADYEHLAFRLLLAPGRTFGSKLIGNKLISHREDDWNKFYPILNSTSFRGR